MYYEKAIEKDSHNAKAYTLLGILLYEKDETEIQKA